MGKKITFHKESEFNNLRIILLLSTISLTPVKINGIELQEHQFSLLQLLEKVQKGCVVKIHQTGQKKVKLTYKPGVLMGGKNLFHECHTGRGITYYLEVLSILFLFCKSESVIELSGVTNHPLDSSIDTFRNVTTSWISKFLHESPIEPKLEIKKRGFLPDAGGLIIYVSPFVKNYLKPIQITEVGLIKKIKGMCYSSRMDPIIGNRVVEACKGVCLNFIPDVWIRTDYHGKKTGGNSPGLGIHLTAETNEGAFLAVDYVSKKGGLIPEEIGRHGGHVLLEEINLGESCVDSIHQWLVCILMSITSQDVNKLRVSKLTQYNIVTMRLIKQFFGVEFMFQQDKDRNGITLICVGSGLKNLSRKSS